MTTTAPTPRTQGVHHVGLTVSDLESARSFFEDALGFSVVGAKPEYPAVFVSDGAVMITLWQVREPESAGPFDRHGVLGLHHLALRVADSDALAALYRDLSARGDVSIEFSPESLGGGATQHMMCSIPGGIRLELIAIASA